MVQDEHVLLARALAYHILGADVLIDDNAHRFARFPGRRVLFDAPHNALETGHPRVASWAEVARLLLDGDVAPRCV